jgi:hypothetical protein
MIYILTIGGTSYAFPNNKGLATVVETLARATEISSLYYGSLDRGEPIKLSPRPVRVEIHVRADLTLIKGRGRPDAVEPDEVIMPGSGMAVARRGSPRLPGRTAKALIEGAHRAGLLLPRGEG